MRKISLLLIIILSVLTQCAFACDKYESQFVGFVSVTEKVQEGCILDIQFDLYNENILCPLLREDVKQMRIIVDSKTCEKVSNTHMGGYLYTDYINDIVSLEF